MKTKQSAILPHLRERLARYEQKCTDILAELVLCDAEANDGEAKLAIRDELNEALNIKFAYRLLVKYASAEDPDVKAHTCAALNRYLSDNPNVQRNIRLQQDLKECGII